MKKELKSFQLNENEIVDIDFWNIRPLITRIPTSLYTTLKQEVDHLEQNLSEDNRHNSSLNSKGVSSWYYLKKNKDILKDYVFSVLLNYQNRTDYFKSIRILSKNYPYYFGNPLVNFQKKHDFLPYHSHDGVVSYNIWMSIPEDMGTGKFAGQLQFEYTNILGELVEYTFNVNKDFEGVMIMFPSKLKHCVYPFYDSDKYRISINGNILLGDAPNN